MPRRNSVLYASSKEAASTFSLDQDLMEMKRQYEAASELMQKNQQSAGVSREQLASRIADLEREQSDPSFWDESNAARAAAVNAQLSEATSLAARFDSWDEWHGDATAALEMLDNTLDDSSSSCILSREEQQMLLDELTNAVTRLNRDNVQAELEWLLSGPYDDSAARIYITAGAGGTEANDWVDMLARMYQRYCDKRQDFTCQTIDAVPGDQVGFKSVELLVTGPRAYGWLQGEKGAHRLVRISPFNAQNKRQTTFAGVDVAPDLPENDQTVRDLVLPEADLEITNSRSGGSGGQNVNKVSSAVRIKHLPSGLAVRCTEERSQLQNREIALNRLKAQLLAIAQEQRVREIQEIRGDMVEASWGAQIRNYVLHPYKQVKDQRTGWETSNAVPFLDGELLDDCVGAYLRWKAEKERQGAEEERA